MSIGKMFMSAILAEGSVPEFLQYGSIEHLFKASEIDAFKYLYGHVKKYGALPDPDTLEAHTGESLVPHKEPSGYYLDLMTARHVELELRRAMKKAAEKLSPDDKNPEEALRIMTESVMELVAARYSRQITDFRKAYDLVVGDYTSKFVGGDGYGLRLGWPTLDKVSGGLMKGDMLSIVGRPQKGKSWQMLYAAHNGWLHENTKKKPEHDQSRMFVSMEMSILSISQRLAAMQTHIPAGKIKNTQLSSNYLKKLKDGLIGIQGYEQPFYIVDGNLTATVEQIAMLARQLKPAAIFIDGAYLVKHPSERDRYKRVAENCELMKQELSKLAPTVCSWQFARTAAKKKKGEKADLEDIGYTDAIAQVSSIVLGLTEEDSVETLKQRKVDILKGRSGEVGSFNTKWDFDRMDFSEIEAQTVEELQFL